MEMIYMKLYWDDLDALETLSASERGRLLTAILQYGRGEEPKQLTGVERTLFPIFRNRINRDRAALQAELEDLHEKRVLAGRQGGLAKARKSRQKLADVSKPGNNNNDAKNEDYGLTTNNPTGDIPPESPPGQVFAYSPEFERFWAAYPKKASKGDAYKAFNRITGVPLSVMLYAIDDQRHSRQWTEDNGRYIPNPATWLNRRNWENGPTETEPQSNGNTFAELARELEKEEQHEPF